MYITLCEATLFLCRIIDIVGVFCSLQGTDKQGPPGDAGEKGDRGESGIPSTEPGIPGDLGLKGFTGDLGSLKCTSYLNQEQFNGPWKCGALALSHC